ncbi:MAG: hypothetical protein MUO21_09175, partial [Nitrososphaeraceae archaeon]|nr:hypothetical protein [Nitrososphaeraceae archaeon]
MSKTSIKLSSNNTDLTLELNAPINKVINHLLTFDKKEDIKEVKEVSTSDININSVISKILEKETSCLIEGTKKYRIILDQDYFICSCPAYYYKSYRNENGITGSCKHI